MRVLFPFCLLLLLAMALLTGLFTWYPVRYWDAINRYGDKLEASMIYAVIHTESKFRPNARSYKDAAGLMQLTDPTARWIAGEMGMTDFDMDRILEPEINIAIGCYFLNWLMDYYDNDIKLALCAYNAGIGNVNRWLDDARYSPDGSTLTVIPFPETRQYIERVTKAQKIYDFILFVRRYL